MKNRLVVVLGIAGISCFAPREAAAQAPSAADGIAASYLNSEWPSWLQFSGEERARLETLDGVGYLPGSNTYLLNRLRLNLAIKPVSWLKFVFQAQDSRSFFTNVSPVPASQKDPIDLRIGYVQIGNSETGWLSVTAGRQPLNFGEGRLVADPQWSNVGRSFDAVRMTLHHNNLKLDLFSGASDKIYINGFATPTPGEHFDGLYGSIEKWIPGATIEPYVFWRMEHNFKGEVVKFGNLDEKTAGVRWVGKLPLGFDYGMETAFQRGTQAHEPLSAWATHLVLGETLPDTDHKPRFFAEFNRGSGDHNPKDGIHNTFDTLFPSAHDKFGVADLFGWANIVHVRAGFQYQLQPSLAVGIAYNSFWLANQRDGIYSGAKQIIASNGLQGNHIGQEPDIQARWTSVRMHNYVDVALGHLFTGESLRNTGHSSGFNCLLLGVTQRF